MTDIEKATDPIVDSALLLIEAGLARSYVVQTLKLNPVQVAALSRTTITTSLPPEERDLAEKVRALIDFAIQEAYIELQFGAPQDRASLIKVLVGRGAGLLGKENTTHIDEMRTMFDEMRTEARDPEVREVIDVFDEMEAMVPPDA